jgi:hypothetical protein
MVLVPRSCTIIYYLIFALFLAFSHSKVKMHNLITQHFDILPILRGISLETKPNSGPCLLLLEYPSGMGLALSGSFRRRVSDLWAICIANKSPFKIPLDIRQNDSSVPSIGL